jgi:hypothetical protein
MKMTARWPWVMALGLIGLVLAASWLQWPLMQHVPWVVMLVAALAFLFVVRLRQQWQPPADSLRWASQPLLVLRAVTKGGSRGFEFLVFALIAAAILYQVLVPPVVGLADNGDFRRMMDQTGLTLPTGEPYNKPFQFIDLRYVVDEPRAPDAGYVSSELIFVNAALMLNKLASVALTDGVFDLRLLGTLHAAALLTSLLLVLSATRSLPGLPRWIVGLLLLLVFTDVGYVAYLNSLYRLPATLAFLTMTVACALLYIRAPKANFRLLLAYFLAATLFACVKPQYIPHGFLLAAFGVLLSRRWSWRSYQRWASLGMAAVVCLIATGAYLAQPDPLREINLYNQVFTDLLPHSPAPEDDLADLGLDRNLVRLAETDAYNEEAPINDPQFREEFFGQVSSGSLLEFYATHPSRSVGMLNRAAGQTFSLRPENLGNFEEASGASPGAKSQTFALWSSVRESFPSKSLAGLVAAFSLATLAAVRVRRRCNTSQCRMLAELFLLLLVMAALDFTIVCLASGALDVVRHLFVFNLLADMLVIMTAGYMGKWWTTVVK